MSRYLGVVHRARVMLRRDAGLVAFGHGRRRLVEDLAPGDTVIYYAPRTEPGGAPVRAFVAHATVTGTAAVERRIGDDTDWVRAAAYDDVAEVPIRPLLDTLELTAGRGRNWGMVLRGGRITLGESDYRRLADALLGRG